MVKNGNILNIIQVRVLRFSIFVEGEFIEDSEENVREEIDQNFLP